MELDWLRMALALSAGVLLGAALSYQWMKRSRTAESEGTDDRLWDTESHEPGSIGWLEGADLMRYPDQLARLERTLDQSCMEAEDQVVHLRRQRDRLGSKDQGEALSARYEADATQLQHRHAQLQRVLGLVWRTRSILILRVKVAIVARACPRMGELPILPEEESAEWDGVADAFRAFRVRVRKAMRVIRVAATDLALSLPSAPSRARTEAEANRAISEELARARLTLEIIEKRMDHLADTVAYLADRCRTREVVESAPMEIGTEGNAEELLNDVSEALFALDLLSDLADQRLAEDAMDNLSAGITQLEREGLDAQAESDAAMEVDRLIEQFPSSGLAP